MGTRVNRSLADEQAGGGLAVRAALRDQPKDVELALTLSRTGIRRSMSTTSGRPAIRARGINRSADPYLRAASTASEAGKALAAAGG